VSVVRGFGRFWWDFVVGDDWKIAVAVVTALTAGTVVAVLAAATASWPAPVAGAAVVAAFASALALDVRRSGRAERRDK